jgi:rare lipoprotein A
MALRPVTPAATLGIIAALLSGCAGHAPTHRAAATANANERGYYKIGQPYEVDGVTYTPAEDWNYDETGIASWYGADFHGKRTANGELYDMNQVTAAHKTLPMPSLVKVTNLDNGREIIVRVNDRGPYSRGRVIDLSRRGAQLLGFEKIGTAKVRVQIMARESQALADAARQGVLAVDMAGIDPDQPPPPPASTPSYTRPGATEVAVAQTPPALAPAPLTPRASPPPASAPPVKVAQTTPPDVAVVDEKSQIQREMPAQKVKGEDIGGRFLPAPQLAAVHKVRPTSIYIQAGAFSVVENAERLRTKLGQVARTEISPTTVGGREFYRVRIGPIASVDEADQLLGRVVAIGAGDAKIVVD